LTTVDFHTHIYPKFYLDFYEKREAEPKLINDPNEGLVFGLLFVFVVHPNFPGGLNTRDNLIKGLVWGWTLWLVSSSVWMPLLFGSGFLFGTWGYANLAYNFVWHSVYGFFLGTLYNPLLKPTV